MLVRLGRRPARRAVLAPLLWLLGLAAVVVLALGTGLPGLPELRSPVEQEQVDRSPPPVLQSLQDLARYNAATGNFQVVVDLERDVRNVPGLIAGERTLFLAQGSVDGFVDFGRLAQDAVQRSPDGSSVTVTLPPAELSPPRIDPSASRVVSRERGVLDRVGGVFSDSPTSERELYVRAEERMAEAARAGDLRRRTEDNTRAMLTGMLQGLGYRDVTVVFQPDARP